MKRRDETESKVYKRSLFKQNETNTLSAKTKKYEKNWEYKEREEKKNRQKTRSEEEK